MRADTANGSVEIGHVVFGHALQRTPAATEALYLAAAEAFASLGNRRLEWKCDSSNQRSRRAAARFGFRYEGTFHQHMVVKGRNRDSAWFSILDCEWPLIKAALETWLAPENFDEAGRQRRGLVSVREAMTPRDERRAGAAPQLELRLARPEDVPAIERIVAQAYGIYVERLGRPPAPMLDDYSDKVRDATVYLAAAGDPIGVLVLIEGADHVLIENVAVHPAHQGRGVGRALMAWAEAYAQQLGHAEMRLYTNALMSENLALYPRLGYVSVGRRAENGFDRVYFRKQLAQPSA